MSIAYMTAVWADTYYQQSDKGKLLVALAIADCADDTGRAFPGVEYIARKARTSARGVQEICRVLEKDGKLVIDSQKGPNGTNIYHLRGVKLVHPLRKRNRVNGVKQVQGELASGCKLAPKEPAEEAPKEAPVQFTQTVRNHQEPSGTVRNPSPDEGASRESESRHTKFIRLWSERFETHFRTKYPFAGGRDGKAVAALVKDESEPIEEIIRTAERAWSIPGFVGQSAAVIHSFHDQRAKIVQALTCQNQGPNGQHAPERKYRSSKEFDYCKPDDQIPQSELRLPDRAKMMKQPPNDGDQR